MIRCIAPSGWGLRRCRVVEGVPRLVDIPAHSVGLGGAELVARTPGGAGYGCVPVLDFMSVVPAVALLVLGGFD
jgi:hypothetical protein